MDIVIRSDAMNDAENDSGKQHVLHQFGREENVLEFLFLLDGIPVEATRWRADMIFLLDVNFRFVVDMEPLSQLCVINTGRNLCGKLMDAEECLLL